MAFLCYSFHLDVFQLEERRCGRRYGADYDVMTIREVFPDNELAEWVIEARVAGRRTTSVVSGHVRLSYERSRFEFRRVFEWPKQICSYEEECCVQEQHRHYREKTVMWPNIQKSGFENARDSGRPIYEGEELPEVHSSGSTDGGRSERRRTGNVGNEIPEKEQHEAQEPDFDRWDALQARKRKLEEEKLKVSI